MDDVDRVAIRELLEAHNTITLATCRNGNPWAASLFFTSDRNLNLYFVSDLHTRHAQDIGEGAEVAATVNTDCSEWTEVKGLQISGFAEVVGGLERMNALRLYLLKFPDVKTLFETPKDKDEETISRRLKSANMYRLKPGRIRLIDNSKWFGYKFEIDFESG